MLTGAIGAGVALAFGAPGAQASVLGMLVALSSTAVVLKTLSERGETDSPLGQTSFGILVFQDVLVLPMMLVRAAAVRRRACKHLLEPADHRPGDRGRGGRAGGGKQMARAPAALRSRPRRGGDVFLMAVVTICFAVAGLAAGVGLSLALGAFLAGLIISEEFSHQALGYVLPFRNLLVSFFFVSVGMLLDLRFLAGPLVAGDPGHDRAHGGQRRSPAPLAVMVLRYPLRVAVGTGLTLSQVGEFSFVLAAVATASSLLPHEIYQGFLAVAVLSMAVTPIVMGRLPWVFRLLRRSQPAEMGQVRGTSDGGGGGKKGSILRPPDHHRLRTEREEPGPGGTRGRDPVRHRGAEPAGPCAGRRPEEPIFFGDATNEGVLAAVRAGSAPGPRPWSSVTRSPPAASSRNCAG